MWFQNRRAKFRKKENTKKGPGRPAHNAHPQTCSGEPISYEELERKERERREKKLLKQLEKQQKKLAAKGIHVDMESLKKDYDHQKQGGKSQLQFDAHKMDEEIDVVGLDSRSEADLSEGAPSSTKTDFSDAHPVQLLNQFKRKITPFSIENLLNSRQAQQEEKRLKELIQLTQSGGVAGASDLEGDLLDRSREDESILEEGSPRSSPTPQDEHILQLKSSAPSSPQEHHDQKESSASTAAEDSDQNSPADFPWHKPAAGAVAAPSTNNNPPSSPTTTSSSLLPTKPVENLSDSNAPPPPPPLIHKPSPHFPLHLLQQGAAAAAANRPPFSAAAANAAAGFNFAAAMAASAAAQQFPGFLQNSLNPFMERRRSPDGSS